MVPASMIEHARNHSAAAPEPAIPFLSPARGMPGGLHQPTARTFDHQPTPYMLCSVCADRQRADGGRKRSPALTSSLVVGRVFDYVSIDIHAALTMRPFIGSLWL